MSAVLMVVLVALLMILGQVFAYFIVWLEEKYQIIEKLMRKHDKEKDNDRNDSK